MMIRRTRLTMVGLMLVTMFDQAGVGYASPGPPPPEYIVKAAQHVFPTLSAATFAAYADDLADDLTVLANGRQVAATKAAWLALERHRLGRVDRVALGHTEGFDSILVFDRIDDRSDLPDDPHLAFDPRYVTRAVRYQFAADHKVHAIQIVQTEGLYLTK